MPECFVPGCVVQDVHTHGTGGVYVCEEVVMNERDKRGRADSWQAEAKYLRAMLREAEWAGVANCEIGHGWARRCPWCDACEHCGHTLDCRLKAALEE